MEVPRKEMSECDVGARGRGDKRESALSLIEWRVELY